MEQCNEMLRYRFSKLKKSLFSPCMLPCRILQRLIIKCWTTDFHFTQVSSHLFYPPVGSDAQTSLRGFLQLAFPRCSPSLFCLLFSSPLLSPTSFWSTDSWSHMEKFAPWRWGSVCCSLPTFKQLPIDVAERGKCFYFLKTTYSVFLGRITVNFLSLML